MSTSTGATLTQNLSLPANVTPGGTVQAGDVSTLYTSLNNFAVPANVAAYYQQVYSTDSNQVIVGGTSTSAAANFIDVTISAVAASRTLIHEGTFFWGTTGAGMGIFPGFRVNGTYVIGASTASALQTISTGATGSGMYRVILGPRDSGVPTPVVGFIAVNPGGGMLTFGSTGTLSTAAATSVGVGFFFNSTAAGSSTGSSVNVSHMRVIREV